MKTKMKLHLIIYIAIAILATACENEIPYTSKPQETKLILNALLDAGTKENNVYLHLAEGNSIGRVDEATLSLYVNGKLAETPQAVSAEEIYGHLQGQVSEDIYEALLKSLNYKRYRLTTAFTPGDHIRLEATAEGGKYHVSSEVIVPQPIENLQVDTCLAYLRVYKGQELHRQYKITLQDRPNERNYYRLEILNDFSYRCEWKELVRDENGEPMTEINENGYWHYVYATKDTIINDRQTGLINREDVILTDGHPGSYDDESNELFPTITNKYNIFTDSRFSNSTATLKVYTPHYQDYYPMQTYYDQIYRTQTITVRLLCLTEAEYRYLKALNCLDDGDYDETIMEPITLPGNVENGLGFVGVCSSVETRIVLPEEARY